MEKIKTGNHGNALLMENSKRASTSECWRKREAESEWRKRGRKERQQEGVGG